MAKLQQGDVFELKAGHAVRAVVPKCFVYDNIHEDMTRVPATVTIGNELVNNYPVVYQGQLVGETEEHYETDDLIGEYVVELTRMSGGGTGHGLHDVYPDGHHVRARRLSESGFYDPNGIVVEFYQSGCFTNMIGEDDVEVKRKMSKKTMIS